MIKQKNRESTLLEIVASGLKSLAFLDLHIAVRYEKQDFYDIVYEVLRNQN